MLKYDNIMWLKILVNKLRKKCGYIDYSEYLQYGKCPGFTIWTNDKHCLTGHILVKKTDSNNEIAYSLITHITKLCAKNDIAIDKTLETININLKQNGLL